MQRQAISRRTLIAGAGTAAFSVAVPAARAETDQTIVGSWFLTIIATNPPVGEFNGLISFHEGGIVTEARRYYVPGTPVGSFLETSGHGAWKMTGKRAYEAFFRFLIQEAPPSVGGSIGTDNVRLALTLDPEADTLRGDFESEIRDGSNAVLFAVVGRASGERIAV